MDLQGEKKRQGNSGGGSSGSSSSSSAIQVMVGPRNRYSSIRPPVDLQGRHGGGGSLVAAVVCAVQEEAGKAAVADRRALSRYSISCVVHAI
jgi:hypothetical protein